MTVRIKAIDLIHYAKKLCIARLVSDLQSVGVYADKRWSRDELVSQWLLWIGQKGVK